jgi:hypothetical protein
MRWSCHHVTTIAHRPSHSAMATSVTESQRRAQSRAEQTRGAAPTAAIPARKARRKAAQKDEQSQGRHHRAELWDAPGTVCCSLRNQKRARRDCRQRRNRSTEEAADKCELCARRTPTPCLPACVCLFPVRCVVRLRLRPLCLRLLPAVASRLRVASLEIPRLTRAQ